MGKRGIRVSGELLEELVDGEVDGVGGAGAEAHGGDSAVEGSRTVRFKERGDGLMKIEGGFARRGLGLHPGFDGVDGEHGGVLDDAGDGAGDHELPEGEAVVGDDHFDGGEELGVEFRGRVRH